MTALNQQAVLQFIVCDQMSFTEISVWDGS